MTYLATPYSHGSGTIRRMRYHLAIRAAAALTRRGHDVVSPVVMLHPIAEAANEAVTFERWGHICMALLRSCQQMLVLDDSGTDKSVGIKAEAELAKTWNIPVERMTLEEMEAPPVKAV